MYGDVSRDTSQRARRARHTRVLLQQGRPLLDADFNEQSAIHHDFLRALIVDLEGRGWRPAPAQFSITGPDPKSGFQISAGHFYVDGILCENAVERTYAKQQFASPGELIPESNFLVYLECWERHVSATQLPDLREIALGGPDTAARTQIVWQVRVATENWVNLESDRAITASKASAAPQAQKDALKKTIDDAREALVKEIGTFSASLAPKARDWFDALAAVRPRLRAMAKREPADTEACTLAADARYRGLDNQLYRVEVHQGGSQPTFKWSRENGSVLFAVRGNIEINGGLATIPLETLGHDRRTGLCVGDWVEITNEHIEVGGLAGPLAKITEIDRMRRSIVVSIASSLPEDGTIVVRRWDQTEHVGSDGCVAVSQGLDPVWIPLERGVQIQFEAGGVYRTGDYWLIPARVASGDVLWPRQGDVAVYREPDGVERHRAAIGHARHDNPGKWTLSSAGRSLNPTDT